MTLLDYSLPDVSVCQFNLYTCIYKYIPLHVIKQEHAFSDNTIYFPAK